MIADCPPTQCHRWCTFWGSVEFFMPSSTTATRWTQCSFWDQKPSLVSDFFTGRIVWDQSPSQLMHCFVCTVKDEEDSVGVIWLPFAAFWLHCRCFTSAVLTDTQLVWLHYVQCIVRKWSDEESGLLSNLFSVTICGCTIRSMSDSNLAVKVILAPLLPETEWTKWIFDCWARDALAKDIY